VAYVSSGLTFFYWPFVGIPIVKGGPVAWNGAWSFWVANAAGFGNIGLISIYLYKAVGRNDIAVDGESCDVDGSVVDRVE